MSKALWIRLTVLVVVVGGAAWWWRTRPPVPVAADRPTGAATQPPAASVAQPGQPAPLVPPQAPFRSAAEKAARVAEIHRDYDEIRAKASAEFAAGGVNYPGGLNAFLRQLALLEREKRRDLAAVLDPLELEDLEMRETAAGQLVTRFLDDAGASEAQRREVFRVQRTFEEEFSLTFDLTPPALLAREAARQKTQEKIRTVLGDEKFVAWLRSEGPEFSQISAFAERQGLPGGAALNLWQAKNELTLRRLELSVQPGVTGEYLRQAQDYLTRQAEERVVAILGPGAMAAAKQEVLGWLPRN